MWSPEATEKFLKFTAGFPKDALDLLTRSIEFDQEKIDLARVETILTLYDAPWAPSDYAFAIAEAVSDSRIYALRLGKAKENVERPHRVQQPKVFKIAICDGQLGPNILDNYDMLYGKVILPKNVTLAQVPRIMEAGTSYYTSLFQVVNFVDFDYVYVGPFNEPIPIVFPGKNRIYENKAIYHHGRKLRKTLFKFSTEEHTEEDFYHKFLELLKE